MLETVDGKRMTVVPHAPAFDAAKKQLGPVRVSEVQAELNVIVDDMERDKKTGSRTFSSSILGSQLSPWPSPISHLYHVARVLKGQGAYEQQVQDRAALLFGQFVWECIMNRQGETWAFYDPNLSGRDSNRELMGKVYFERFP